MNSLVIQRRQFIQGGAALGAGLSIGLTLPLSLNAQPKPAAAEVGVWVLIRPDEKVIIRIARSEMGQGTLTGLAQLVAEELECDWKYVTTEYPTPGENLRRKRVWGSYSTGGSRGIRESQEYVRQGGAAARTMLLQAAAQQWGVPAGELTVSQGVIRHSSSRRQTTYGQVAQAAAQLSVPTTVELKKPGEWKIIGQSVRRLDTRDKVNGRQVYAIDLKLPGMRVANIRQCPVFGGKLKSFDAQAIQGLKGVHQVVAVDDNAVAVIADTFWVAKTALDQVKIDWDLGPHAQANSAHIEAMLFEGLGAEQAFVGNESGNMATARTQAASTHQSRYFYPFLNHAPLEPMNATAVWTPERCEAWVPTQDGEASLAAVIAASGLRAEQCDVHKVNLGGGFGRRGAFQDYTRQAVLIARQMPGTPIKLIWTREEDMTHGHYHPVMACQLTGTFDAQKKLTGLHMRLSGQSILAAVRPAVLEQQKGRDPLVFQGVFEGGEHGFGYAFPNLKVDHAMRNTHVPPGFWRGVNSNQNAVFIECFMDELAEQAGLDPLAFRRQFMGPYPRNLAVLNAVAERIGWDKPAAPGVHRGLAQMKAFGSFVAAACELSVQGKKVKIHRIVAATDPGYAVNPAQIERQVSGSFVYGLSALFMQECTVKNGRIEQTNFDTFGSMRLAQMPKVETIIIQGGGQEWGGIGEPTICVAAPAVLNAIYRATGERLRTVPLNKAGYTLV
ncbi:MAG: molybdopterin-dependent oxidoreductase [Alphaproteobacteria bacterium]|nr:molybdopterin-dependent oxidoreductase [Alphaproteobacteria bacterium]